MAGNLNQGAGKNMGGEGKEGSGMGESATPMARRPGKEIEKGDGSKQAMKPAAPGCSMTKKNNLNIVPTQLDRLEDEEDVVHVDLTQAAKKFSKWIIVAFFLTTKVFKANALFTTMRRVWKPYGGLWEKPIANNRFIVEFEQEGDYLHVLRGGPWTHDNDALLVTAYDGKTTPSEVPIVILPMWARTFDLPLPMMDDIFGREVGKKLGAVWMVHTDNKGRAFDDFLRVRIEHIVSKPLRKWIVIEDISDPERKKKRCPVKYERVPHFCFFCGFIGHTQSSCLIPEEEKIVRFSTEQRASPYKMFEHRSL